MNAMIQELEKLSTTETVTKEQFKQLTLIVLEIARSLESQSSQHRINKMMNERE
jgi:hypothetical protein